MKYEEKKSFLIYLVSETTKKTELLVQVCIQVSMRFQITLQITPCMQIRCTDFLTTPTNVKGLKYMYNLLFFCISSQMFF